MSKAVRFFLLYCTSSYSGTLSYMGYALHQLTNHYLHHSSKCCLIQLHWLPVQSRVIFKIIFLPFKSLSSSTPAYSSNLIQQKPNTKILRSFTSPLLKQQLPQIKTSFQKCLLLLSGTLYHQRFHFNFLF